MIMNTNENNNRFKSKRTAFTLVEMLIVGAIIVILAGLTLLATNAAATAAKETKTRATIQKLDTAMQQIFETYENKFAVLQSAVNTSLVPEVQQKIATHFARDLMRMEMPQCWAEVNPGITQTPLVSPDTREESPLLPYYRQAYVSAKAALSGKEPCRAALLFLVIQSLNPEALEAFHASEVADTDGDGLLEFVDAWGHPIYFLRWAPAFSGSDIQPNILTLCDPKYVPQTSKDDNKDWWEDHYGGTTEETRQPLWKAMEQAQYLHPDPFDENKNTVSWFLYPLIYSAGADGKYDMIADPPSPEAGTAIEILDPFAYPAGMPGDTDGNGTLNHFDNIHNHRWYKSF